MSFRLRSFQWIGTGLMILFVSSAPGNDEPLQNPEEILPIPDLIGKAPRPDAEPIEDIQIDRDDWIVSAPMILGSPTENDAKERPDRRP